ncbi:hypothetical protein YASMINEVIRUS_768 [Yasminevirus sp. GU-2018]|uniref:Uncharacterized protein n=1 Tax=Yasminevirus sp. GU-2018 TaxID=2420051 RepID=A0A5K0U934_9VIRU|nr:hypothetical protein YASMINEVIRUS_768 [Yasminevirus sp. GU-2018]
MVFGSESNLIIFLMIALIVLLVYHRQVKGANNTCSQNNDEKSKEGFRDVSSKKSKKHQKKRNSRKNDDDVDDDIDMDVDVDVDVDVDQLMNIMKGAKSPSNHRGHSTHNKSKRPEMNGEFAEMQYHKDYADTITAINNLTPQKELFNLGFLPVVESTPDKANVKSLVKLFLKKLNFEVSNNVEEFLHTNSGWNDMGKRRREKSGFEEQMEELGLPGTLYTEGAEKGKVKLVKVDKAEQFTTDDQIRFTVYMIVQKENVKDQMVLQVQFFMEREDLSGNRDDRANFFDRGLPQEGDETKIDADQVVIIEQVFTLGYLTNATAKKTKMDKFHDYDGVHRADGTIDQEKVIKTMLRKHKERENELNSFVSTLDNEAQEVYDVPDVGPYSQYKNTRTIMDDLAKFPQRSFGDVPI